MKSKMESKIKMSCRFKLKRATKSNNVRVIFLKAADSQLENIPIGKCGPKPAMNFSKISKCPCMRWKGIHMAKTSKVNNG